MKTLLLSAGLGGLLMLFWLLALATIFTTPALWVFSIVLRRLRPWLNL